MTIHGATKVVRPIWATGVATFFTLRNWRRGWDGDVTIYAASDVLVGGESFFYDYYVTTTNKIELLLYIYN